MKVIELIAELQKVSPEAEVRIMKNKKHYPINICLACDNGVLVGSTELDEAKTSGASEMDGAIRRFASSIKEQPV